MSFTRVLLAGLLAALAACGSDREGDPSLRVACALKSCECVPKGGLFKSGSAEAVSWHQNGDAYCREGYALRLSDEEEPPRNAGSKERKGGVKLNVPRPSF